jgi:hypothetical protein
MILFFIVFLGKAVQCASQTGCVPVPYEAVAEMIQFGVLEMIMEIGAYKYYRVKRKKDE